APHSMTGSRKPFHRPVNVPSTMSTRAARGCATLLRHRIGSNWVTLDGKVVLVTGAGRGIGRATAILAGRRGAAVGLCDVNQEPGAQTAAIIREEVGRATFVRADVRVSAEVGRFVASIAEDFGRIDVLVNNAGLGGGDGTIDRLQEDECRRVLGVNLDG